jgi:DNA-binding XRE family transcriptional regulator
LTLAAIGRRVGISREAARLMVLASALPPCATCEAPLPRGSRGGRCPACVTADPSAPFAERLRALRVAAGLTQAELAGRAGLPLGTLGHYECGRVGPQAARLAALARVLGPGLVAGAGGRAP